MKYVPQVGQKGSAHMKDGTKAARKKYSSPRVTRVKLEDKRVVAMAACKDSLDNPRCGQDGVTPLLTINPS
jgi:hypothetical protein